MCEQMEVDLNLVHSLLKSFLIVLDRQQDTDRNQRRIQEKSCAVIRSFRQILPRNIALFRV